MEDEFGEELAYCKGVVLLGMPKARISWLGRSGGRHVHKEVRGIRCIGRHPGSSTEKSTVGQAMLGLTAGFTNRFGCRELEATVDDDGSGKLLRYYSDCGFQRGDDADDITAVARNAPSTIFGLVGSVTLFADARTICAPPHVIEGLAPLEWLTGLIPPGFNFVQWLCSHLPPKMPKARVLLDSERKGEEKEIKPGEIRHGGFVRERLAGHKQLKRPVHGEEREKTRGEVSHGGLVREYL